MERKRLGALGEKIAISLLRSRGYRILAKNFQTRFGEVDIVAKDGDTLAFVEVKTRISKDFGRPEEYIRMGKLRTMEKVAQIFRASHPNLPQSERIDVVAIEIGRQGQILRQELIQNAAL